MLGFVTFFCFSWLVIACLLKFNLAWQERQNGAASFPTVAASSTRQTLFTALLAVVGMALLARGSVWLYGWLCFMLQKGQYIGFFESFREIWVRWDAWHYLGIADNGYVNSGDERFRLVFYPLYPALIALLKFTGLNAVQAGTLLSLAAFAGACAMLYRLVLRETNDTHTAWHSCVLLAFFPFSFFYGMVYTESLFLLLTISCFWFLRGQQWLAAGLVGLCAALTRNQGLLLLVPIGVDIALHWRAGTLQRPRHALAAVLLVPTGILLYLGLNYAVSGDPLRFVEYQQLNWQQSFGWLPNNLAGAAERLLTGEQNLGLGTWLPTLLMFFAAVIVLAAGMRVMPLPYLAYALVYLLISYSPTWLISGPRYLGGLFPLAIATALLCRKHRLLQSATDAAMVFGIALFVPLLLRNGVY